jgi:hypothetical protein
MFLPKVDAPIPFFFQAIALKVESEGVGAVLLGQVKGNLHRYELRSTQYSAHILIRLCNDALNIICGNIDLFRFCINSQQNNSTCCLNVVHHLRTAKPDEQM